MSHTGTIKIPVLFDMSGDTIVYGEDVTGDFVTSHLDFILDMTTEANDISLNAADISEAVLVGDQDNTDNLFYSGGSSGNIAVDKLCNRIAKAITRGKLVHIPKSGNHSNSGIPLGGRAELVDATGTHTIYHIQNEYTQKYFTSVAPIGDEQMLGEAMARVASIHLVGTPLAAAAFENKNSVQADLETASTQTFNSGNTAFYNALAVQLSKVLGGSKSSAPMKPAGNPIAVYSMPGSAAYDVNKAATTQLDSAAQTQLRAELIADLKIVTGNANATIGAYDANVLATNHPNAENFPRGYFVLCNNNSHTNNVYELAFNPSTTSTATGMPIGYLYSQGSHFGWGIMQDKPNQTAAGGFPFIAGDKLVMYLRPKIVFAAQTKAEQSTTLVGFAGATTLSVPVYDLGRKSSAGGSISGQVYTESSFNSHGGISYGFHMAFQGTSTTDTEKWITKNNNYNKYSTSYPWNYAGIEKTQNVDGSSELLGEWEYLL